MMNAGQAAQVIVIGVEVLSRLVSGPLNFGLLQPWGDSTHNAGGHLILQVEDVLRGAIKAVGPQMRPSSGVDKLPRNPHPTSCLSDAPFKEVTNPQFAPDLLHIHGSSLVS